MSDNLYTLSLIIILLLFSLDFPKFTFGKNKINKRLDKLEKSVAQLQLRLPHKELDEIIESLLQEGKDVEAIKLVREELNLDLIHAKKYVDSKK